MTDPKSEETLLFTAAVKELVAIGAAIGSSCEMCFKHHFNEARKIGVSKADIRLAVETATMVKNSPARSIAELAEKYVSEPAAKAPCCCGSAGSDEAVSGAPIKKSCC